MPDHPLPEQPKHANTRLKNSHRQWRWLAWLIVIAIGAYFIWGRFYPADTQSSTDSGQTGKSAQDGPPGMSGRPGGPGGPKGPIPVGVTVAKIADVPIYLSGLGSVTPIATTTVKSRVDGQLMNIHFSEGQLVKKGGLLAELDARPYLVQVTQAEGQLARDNALLAAAKIDLKRYQTLLAQDSIATQQVDTQSALVKQYEGTVKIDQGNLDNARLQLSYSQITAPISGRLGLRQVDMGNIVRASDTTGIVVITQLHPITTLFSIPEDNIPAVTQQLRDGKILPVEAWDRDQKIKLASGQLLTIDNQVDSTTGTIKLKAIFQNNDSALFPNQFVNIRMLLHTLRSATVVPSAAIQRGSNGNFVYVVKGNKTIALRLVTIGPVEGELTTLTSGIKPGETVVIDGIDKLREGSKVEPVKRDKSSATAGAKKPGRRPQNGETPATGDGAATLNKHRNPPASGAQPQP